MALKSYKHTVQYYETDQMGIVHHSNYIRWFEEARIDMLKQLGIPFDYMESKGIMSPVLDVQAKYSQPVRFGEEVEVLVKVASFNGIRCLLEYEVIGPDNKVRTTGSTSIAFLNKDGKIFRMKKEEPEMYMILLSQVGEEKNEQSESE